MSNNTSVQTRGRKARTDITLNTAAEIIDRAINRSDITTDEIDIIDGISMQLRALAHQIKARESGYGKKTA